MGRKRSRTISLSARGGSPPCFWCGFPSETGVALRVDKLRLGNFTGWDRARRPDSGWLCPACLFAFKERSL